MKLPELSLSVRLFVTELALFSLQTALLQATVWSQSISTAQLNGEIKRSYRRQHPRCAGQGDRPEQGFQPLGRK